MKIKQQTSTQAGFTLVELVIVITITGILSGILVQFIIAPIDAFTDISRRARLVSIADLAIQKITHDIKRSLPNSIRIGCSGSCVEFLEAKTGGRYRAGPGPSPSDDVLSFNPADSDTEFSVIGSLNHTDGLVLSSSSNACVENLAACVVVYNTGKSGTNAWNADNLASLSAIDVVANTVSFVNSGFSGGQGAFPAASPSQRFYIVTTPVKYICDINLETLTRFQGYSIESDEASVDTIAELTALSNPAENALLANKIVNCSFSYTEGTPTRNSVLTVSLGISENGEKISLLQQLQVANLP